MGTGARAERMALGASIGEKKSYLEQLRAEKEDVGEIGTSQQENIQTLVDKLLANAGTEPIKYITQQVEKVKKNGFVVPLIIGIIVFFLSKRK